MFGSSLRREGIDIALSGSRTRGTARAGPPVSFPRRDDPARAARGISSESGEQATPSGETAPAKETEDGRTRIVAAPERGSLARDSVLLFAARLAGNAGFFVAVLILARGLGPSGRGTMAFVTVTALIVGKISRLGLNHATTVFAAQRPSERPALLTNLLLFNAGSALAGGALAAVALLVLGESRPAGVGATELAMLVFGTVAVALWDESFMLGCRSLRQLGPRLASCGWLYAGLLFLGWALGSLSVPFALIAWTVAQLLSSLLMHTWSAREFGLARPNLRLLRSAIQYGFRASLGALSLTLNNRIDQTLMGFLTTEAALGAYAVAVNGAELLLYLPQAVGLVLAPAIARGAATESPERTLRAFRSATLIAVAGASVAAALGPVLLPLVFGEPFRASVAPFLWLLPGVPGFVAMSIFTGALLGSSSPGRSSLGPFAALIFGVALDLLLIPRYGASGAAAAASAAFIVGGLGSLLIYRRRATFPWRSLIPGRADAVAIVAYCIPDRFR